MASARKIEEAFGHMKEAEKSMKTGLLKWKPDFDVAADEYNAAAKCFKTAKDYIQCRECFLKAAENYKIVRSFFSAAKCVEQAAHASKEIGELDEVAALSERAACLFRDHGVVDTAALTLDKGAKMIEAEIPDKAVHLYKFAIDIVSIEGKPQQAAEYQAKISRSLVRREMFDEAVKSIKREISFYQAGQDTGAIGRLTVALVLVQLARGDPVAGAKSFREWGGYCEFEEVRTLESLLEAFDEQDGDLAKRALGSAFIRHMDVEYSKLARDMPVPKTSEEKKASNQSYSVSAGEGATAEDDEELNLC